MVLFACASKLPVRSRQLARTAFDALESMCWLKKLVLLFCFIFKPGNADTSDDS